jgi:hypothetical protein
MPSQHTLPEHHRVKRFSVCLTSAPSVGSLPVPSSPNQNTKETFLLSTKETFLLNSSL